MEEFKPEIGNEDTLGGFTNSKKSFGRQFLGSLLGSLILIAICIAIALVMWLFSTNGISIAFHRVAQKILAFKILVEIIGPFLIAAGVVWAKHKSIDREGKGKIITMFILGGFTMVLVYIGLSLFFQFIG